MTKPLIVVSNRGPVSYERDEDGRRVERRGAGGLVSALRGLRDRADVTWIASAISQEDRVVAGEGGGDPSVVLLAHDRDVYAQYYDVIANPLLWFVQHSLWGLALRPELDRAVHAAWDDGYARVNEAFAAAVVAKLDDNPEAVVFFHDYHLYLAPAYVRAARPEATIAHFVHIPWPRDWSMLPGAWRDAIRNGLLSNDLLAFHTRRWADAFLAQGDPGSTRVTHHPLSVDPAEFDALAESPSVLEREAELAAARTEKLIVRVDRTDPAKNVVRGFHAFALLLEEHPEWRGVVTMLALLDPSRQSIPEYVEYVRAVEQAAAEVNERFGRDDWQPVDLRIGDDFHRSVAAYKQYDVLLANAVYDGLNLVVKEAPLVNTRDGVVVLSENAGAHEELGDWVLSVNPTDVAGQADALRAALTMPAEERGRRAAAIRSQVRAHDVEAWLAGLLADIDQVSRNVRP